ncbi:hypothetical protein WJ971_24085 [Achromobacter xylosoxidans]
MRRLLLWTCLALCAPPILAGAQPAGRPQAGLAWDFCCRRWTAAASCGCRTSKARSW